MPDIEGDQYIVAESERVYRLMLDVERFDYTGAATQSLRGLAMAPFKLDRQSRERNRDRGTTRRRSDFTVPEHQIRRRNEPHSVLNGNTSRSAPNVPISQTHASSMSDLHENLASSSKNNSASLPTTLHTTRASKSLYSQAHFPKLSEVAEAPRVDRRSSEPKLSDATEINSEGRSEKTKKKWLKLDL